MYNRIIISIKDITVSLVSGVSAHLSTVAVHLDTQESAFEVTMGVWTDDSFSTSLPKDYIVQVPEKMYVGLTLSDGQTAMIFQGRKCWATPR